MAGLILVCVNAGGQTEQKDRAVAHELEHLERHGLEALFKDILLPAYFGDTLARHGQEAAAIMRSGLEMGADAFRNQRRTLRTRIDQYPHLNAIRIPTLLVCGENDTLCPPEGHRRMQRELPHSVLYECKRVGHALPLVRPAELARQAARFMRAIPSD